MVLSHGEVSIMVFNPLRDVLDPSNPLGML